MTDDRNDKLDTNFMAEPWEKKSERFEVRLPFSKKQAFIQACEDQGDTPSEAMRRFIHTYLRRAQQDNVDMTRRAFRSRMRQNLAFGLTGIMAIGAMTVFGPQSCASIKAQNLEQKRQSLFAVYDVDGDGELILGEISANDKVLHEVLDINDSQTISLSEFIVKGRMQLALSYQGEDTAPLALNHQRRLVEFNLLEPEKVILNAWRIDSENITINDKMDRLIFRHVKTGEFSGFLGELNLKYNNQGSIESLTFNSAQSDFPSNRGSKNDKFTKQEMNETTLK